MECWVGDSIVGAGISRTLSRGGGVESGSGGFRLWRAAASCSICSIGDAGVDEGVGVIRVEVVSESGSVGFLSSEKEGGLLSLGLVFVVFVFKRMSGLLSGCLVGGDFTSFSIASARLLSSGLSSGLALVDEGGG